MKKQPQAVAKRQHVYVVGIDPGTHCGISIWNCEKKELVTVETLPIHWAMDRVRTIMSSGKPLLVRVEDATKAVFGRNTEEDRKKAQGAGSIMRDVRIWRDFLKDLGIDFELVRPDKKKTKWDADLFQKVTGWKGRTSEHARDSAMLVYGL